MKTYRKERLKEKFGTTEFEEMDIYSEEGTKVVFADPDVKSMYQASAKKNARKYLKFGEEYTIEKTVVHDWHTEVYLKEFDVPFNSQQFIKYPEKTLSKKVLDEEWRNKIHSWEKGDIDDPYEKGDIDGHDVKEVLTAMESALCQYEEDLEHIKNKVKKFCKDVFPRE